MKNITFIFSLFFCITRSDAQSFAVTSTVQVTSFSAYLSDYSDLNSMFVTLLSTDKRPFYAVYTKIEISGQGYIIKSKPGALGGQYLYLPKNQPVTLTGTALNELLNPGKLSFSGISQQDFIAQGGKLPEGPVSICVTAYDAVLDKPVSNTSCAIGTVQLNYPPDILTPNGIQPVTTPQNLFLSWKPQHIGAFAVEYDVEIYEKTADFGYDVIVSSTAPIFTVTTSQTIYQYTDLDPQLIQGQEYLMRVSVRDLAGVETFENAGWSEIEAFSYGPPGVADCYQWEADFCAYLCNFNYTVLVCEKSSYQAGITNTGTSGDMEAWLNSLGIGDFQLTEEIGVADEYGYCETHLIITASNVLDVPVSLTVSGSGFSDHCLPPPPVTNTTYTPTIAVQNSSSPNFIGKELTFYSALCPEDIPGEARCLPPADSTLEIIAEQPILAQMFWGEVADQITKGFEIEYHLYEAPAWILKDSISADSLNAYIGELQGGLLYEARIRAVCEEEVRSEWSAAIEFNTTCIISNNVWVADKDDISARIEWMPLSYATTYELNYRESGTTDWLSKSTTNPFYDLIGLTPNTTYEYKLRVLCSTEWGGFTMIYAFTTDRPCEGNTVVAEVISNITFNSAYLDWEDEAGATTDQYSIRYRPIGEPVWQVAFSDTSELEFQYLASNTWYQYNISRHCTDIWSDWTSTGSFLTDCAPPASTWTEDITPSSAVLHCTPDIAVNYEFSFRERFTNSWSVKNVSSSLLYLSGLPDDTEYEYKVRIRCDAESEWSEYTSVAYFSTEIACNPPGNYQIADLTPFSARLEWEEAVRPVKWGVYYRRTDGTPIIAQQAGDTIGKISSSITTDGWVYQLCLEPELLLEGLTDNKWYDFKIESWCEGYGWTDTSQINKFLTLADCMVPLGVTAGYVGTSKASIAWETQLGDLSYSVELRQKGGGTWEMFTTLIPQFDFENLLADVTYEYRVKTKCANFGWTDWSGIYEFRTDECIAPSQVMKEYMASNSSIIISWQASAGQNQYRLEYRLQDTLAPPEWTAMETSSDYLEITQLQTGKIYEYRVAENCLSAGLIYNEGLDTFLLGRNTLTNEYFECGQDITPFDPQNFYPLEYLKTGDSITAGDFGVLITQADGQLGNFTGRGYIPVPYFNRARVNVKFKNINVNDEYKLVNGTIKITGIGLQIISQETADLLGNIVDALETLDDLLADAEEILEIIDEIIETLGPYLPQEVIQDLENAQAALTTALATGSDADLATAQAALQTANQNFQDAMTVLLTRVLNIIIESLNQLDQEFLPQADAIITDYETASNEVQQFEIDHNGIYSTTNLEDSDDLPSLEDMEWESEDLTDQQESLAAGNADMNSLITLSNNYFDKIFAYGQMKGVQNLKAEIQTNADLIPFLAALNNKDINLFDYIGSNIADGKTDDEIIPGVKVSILTGIDKILKQL